MKKLILISFTALLLIACKKDQKAVNKLEGTWTADKWEVNDGGITLDLIQLSGSATVIFGACDLESNQWCSYTAYTSLLNVKDTIISEYRVSNKGLNLDIKDSISGTTFNSSQILELETNRLRIKDVSGTQTITITASK